MVHAPTNDFHNLPVPNEPLTTTPATTLETKYSKSVYRKCTAEDENEQAPPNQGTKDLYIPMTLSPGTNSFRTRLLRAGSRRQASLRKTDAVGARENLSSGPAKPGKPLRKWIRIRSSRLFPSRSTRPYSCFSFSPY
jgi:hypothetical protein